MESVDILLLTKRHVSSEFIFSICISGYINRGMSISPLDNKMKVSDIVVRSLDQTPSMQDITTAGMPDQAMI